MTMSNPTLSQATQDFLDGLDAKPKTVRIRRRFLTSFKQAVGQRRRIATLLPLDVERWCRANSWGANSKRMAIQSLNHLLNWAARSYRIENPCQGIPQPKAVSRARDCVPTPEEHEAFLAAASPALRLMILAIDKVGGRPHEVGGVTATHYNPTIGAWVFNGETKTGKRTVYLSPKMVTLTEALAKQHPTGPLFLDDDGQPWTDQTLAKAVAQVRRRLKITKPITAYSWRHKFATDFLLAGGSTTYLATLMGTSVRMIEWTYSHVVGNHLAMREMLKKVRA
jgi:integrase